MTGLSQTSFARLAGTSQQAVSLAVRNSHLMCDAAGRLDPADPLNESWIRTHRAGWGRRGRPLSTWRNGQHQTGGDDGPEPQRAAVDPGHTALEELLERWGEVQIDPAYVDRLRDELITEPGNTVMAAVMAALPDQLAALHAEIDTLRREIDVLRNSLS